MSRDMVLEKMLDCYLLHLTKKFFGANALGILDNESQKGVKNLI